MKINRRDFIAWTVSLAWKRVLPLNINSLQNINKKVSEKIFNLPNATNWNSIVFFNESSKRIFNWLSKEKKMNNTW